MSDLQPAMNRVIVDPGLEAGPVPWEQIDGETDWAYAAFCEYRDMAKNRRQVRRAADRFYAKKHADDWEDVQSDYRATAGELRQIHTWSSRNQWRARAGAWDAHLEHVGLLEQIEEAKEFKASAAAWAKKLLEAVAEATESKVLAGDLAGMSWGDLRLAGETAWKVGASARDVAESITAMQQAEDPTVLAGLIRARLDEIAAEREAPPDELAARRNREAV